jgi:outer membrane protein
MKRSLVCFLILASGLALSAVAQTPATTATTATTAPAPAANAKVAVVAFQAAVGQTNEFQRDFADLQKKYDPKRSELNTMTAEIDTLEKQLQATSDKLNDSERASKAKTIEDKKKQAQRIAEDAQNDYTGEMNDTFNKVATKVLEVMDAYANQQGFTLVIDGGGNQQQAPVVLYASPATDITRAVIDAYNVKSGVPAPPPQAPSASGVQSHPAGPKPAAPAAH